MTSLPVPSQDMEQVVACDTMEMDRMKFLYIIEIVCTAWLRLKYFVILSSSVQTGQGVLRCWQTLMYKLDLGHWIYIPNSLLGPTCIVTNKCIGLFSNDEHSDTITYLVYVDVQYSRTLPKCFHAVLVDWPWNSHIHFSMYDTYWQHNSEDTFTCFKYVYELIVAWLVYAYQHIWICPLVVMSYCPLENELVSHSC